MSRVSVATHRELMMERFLRFAGTGSWNDCWMWRGSLKASNGYGQLTVKQQKFPPHRVAYELFVGPIPDGMVVMHKCDTPGCTNPRHLTTGTTKDNARDMISKNRHHLKSGKNYPFTREQLDSWIGVDARAKRGQVKLNEDKIREIFDLRRSGLTYNQIQSAVGISRAQAHRVVTGQRWQSITKEIINAS